MKIKLLSHLPIIIISLLSTYIATAQTTESEARELLHNIDNAIGNIDAVVYKISHKNKYLSRRDTVYTTALCSLYVAPKDKMKAYNIVDLEFRELNHIIYGHRKYDGKSVFWTNYSIDSLGANIKPTIERKRRAMYAIVENYNSILLREYLNIERPFGRYESAAGMIAITEERLNDTPVYVLKLTFKDTDEVRDNVEKHYIRKSDNLPIAYSSFLRMENMEQYIYYEVDYLVINSDISLAEFKIDMDETINAKARYQMLKRKTGM